MIDGDDLATLDAAVETALATGDESGLCVIGYGEITLVLGWPTDAPRFAAKRLPVFPDPASADRYTGLFDAYLDELPSRGVEPVETALLRRDRADRTVTLYAVQPILPRDQLAEHRLRRVSDDEARSFLERLVKLLAAAVDDRVGLDGQITNWAWDGERLRYYDVSTPFLKGPDGEPLLDVSVFVASLPALLRWPVRRFVAPGLLARYHRPRDVLVDFASNVGRFGLAHHRPLIVDAANQHVDEPITLGEVERYYRSDARLWKFLFRVRRLDRAWQHRVRRRPYPFLLPRSSKW